MIFIGFFFFFNDTATTEIYTLSLHDALPIWRQRVPQGHLYHHALRCELLGPDRDRAVSGDETRNAVRGSDCDFSPSLHSPGPGNGELLLDLTGATVRRVVALHHQHLDAAGN